VRNIRTKTRPITTGGVRGGIPFERGALFYLLRNRFYIGEVRYKGEILPGEQPPIMERALFDAVQQKLTDQWTTKNRVRNPGDHLLTGWVATSDLCPRTRRIAKIAAACGTATRGILAAARLLGTNARSWSTLQGLHHGTGGASPSRRKQIRNNSACPNAVANAAEVWLPCDKSRMSVAEPCAPDVRAVQLLLKSLERVHRTC